MPVPTLSSQVLAEKLRLPEAERPVLLDVRNPEEFALVRLPGSVLIPVHELEEREDELKAFSGKEVVVYCHHGVRSLSGAAFLIARGYNAVSLRGGIDVYSVEVDSSLPRY